MIESGRHLEWLAFGMLATAVIAIIVTAVILILRS
jgi:hypothetical protein